MVSLSGLTVLNVCSLPVTTESRPGLPQSPKSPSSTAGFENGSITVRTITRYEKYPSLISILFGGDGAIMGGAAIGTGAIVGGIFGYPIDAVARAFVPRGAAVDEGFAFIGYLLFPNPLSDNHMQRLAAAATFLCLFEEAEAVEELGTEPERMAVFYSPVRKPFKENEILQRRDVKWFLRAYDYYTAELLARQFGLNLSGVHLVGYIPALGRAADGRPRELFTLDLTDMPPKRIETALLSLDQEFTVAVWDQARGGGVLEIVRQVFGSLGQMLGVRGAEAVPSECR